MPKKKTKKVVKAWAVVAPSGELYGSWKHVNEQDELILFTKKKYASYFPYTTSYGGWKVIPIEIKLSK